MHKAMSFTSQNCILEVKILYCGSESNKRTLKGNLKLACLHYSIWMAYITALFLNCFKSRKYLMILCPHTPDQIENAALRFHLTNENSALLWVGGQQYIKRKTKRLFFFLNKWPFKHRIIKMTNHCAGLLRCHKWPPSVTSFWDSGHTF